MCARTVSPNDLKTCKNEILKRCVNDDTRVLHTCVSIVLSVCLLWSVRFVTPRLSTFSHTD